jgi:gliding motility-associated protein GldC
MRKANIDLSITLDDENIPEKIAWKSTDAAMSDAEKEAKAFMLSIFEKDSLETLRIDLWTKELEIGEMNRFMYYTIRGLSETYLRASNNANLANDLARFAQYFGEETSILKREDT